MYEPINSCLRPLCSMDGMHVITGLCRPSVNVVGGVTWCCSAAVHVPCLWGLRIQGAVIFRPCLSCHGVTVTRMAERV